jgi:hypothetical protein
MTETNKKNEGNRERKRKNAQWSYLRLHLMLPFHPGKNKTDSQYKKPPCLISEKAKFCYRGSFEIETLASLHEL